MATARGSARHTIFSPALTCGFAVSIVLWIAWFITHLPWLGLGEQVSLPVLLAVWLAGGAATGFAVGRARCIKVGGAAGLVSAVVGLLIFLSMLARPAAVGDASEGMRPGTPVIVLGFLALGVAIGAIGGLAGGIASGCPRDEPDPDWRARFAIVAVLAAAPLLFIGGLVTSTNSGMAVPDWPNTYGSNMFLYPLGPRARPDVFLEHSHRLFGTLVGLASVVLCVWVLVTDSRRWIKSLALVLVAIVVFQGGLGGLRVRVDSRLLAFTHGILAQLTLALLVVVAVALSPAWRSASFQTPPPDPAPTVRRLKFFATGFLHATLLQLIFGAMYRHFRDQHSLWTHIGFSVLVVILAAGAGFMAIAITGRYGGAGPILRRLGTAALVVVLLQFLLGWAAFIGGGTEPQAPSIGAALIRTAHQANGALLLGVATALFFWTQRVQGLHRLETGPPQTAPA
jgi:cytochrome c oxidase assembly protein subunit 15